MKTVEVLKAARELISSPEHWIKGVLALPFDGVADEGEELDVMDPKSTCFCSLGALYRANGKNSIYSGWRDTRALPGYNELALAVSEIAATSEIADFNDDDETEHADVLRMFDLAIGIAEEREHG